MHKIYRMLFLRFSFVYLKGKMFHLGIIWNNHNVTKYSWKNLFIISIHLKPIEFRSYGITLLGKLFCFYPR